MVSTITIKLLDKPGEPKLNQDIDWICKSLGFVTPRDMEETASKIFCAVVMAMHEGKELTSQEIAARSNVSRGAALIHLQHYLESGLIVQKRTRYVLRRKSVAKTIEELETDVMRMLCDIKKMANEVDQKLGLQER